MLGETRELRKVFFETIEVKPVDEEKWFTDKLEQIIKEMNQGLPIHQIQNEIEERFFDLYDLTIDERVLVKSQALSQ